MPPGNTEIAREIFAEWGRGDYSGSKWFDPDLEWEQGVEEGTSGAASGNHLASLARYWGDVMSAYEDLGTELEELIEVDDERVLVLNRFSGRARASGLPVDDFRGAALFRFEDGRVTQAKIWSNQETALAELGLKRQSPAQ